MIRFDYSPHALSLRRMMSHVTSDTILFMEVRRAEEYSINTE